MGDDFENYPIVMCEYFTNDGGKKIISGTRADGLCSIWAVLNAWGLLGKEYLINDGLIERSQHGLLPPMSTEAGKALQTYENKKLNMHKILKIQVQVLTKNH